MTLTVTFMVQVMVHGTSYRGQLTTGNEMTLTVTFMVQVIGGSMLQVMS